MNERALPGRGSGQNGSVLDFIWRMRDTIASAFDARRFNPISSPCNGKRKLFSPLFDQTEQMVCPAKEN
jgi:hypothetical protein